MHDAAGCSLKQEQVGLAMQSRPEQLRLCDQVLSAYSLRL